MRLALLAAATTGYVGLMAALGTVTAAVIAATLVTYSLIPRFVTWVLPS